MTTQQCTADTASGNTGTSSGSVLQQDFSNLFASMGVTDAKTTRGDLLDTLYGNLQSGNPGASVNTRA